MSDFNPDAFIQQASAPVAQQPMQPGDTGGFDPDSFLEEAGQAKYGTGSQQAIAGLEGVAKGVAGPLATAAEKYVLKVPEEDIRGREEANPWTHGVGEAAGLGAGMLTGTGEAALLAKAGEGAAAVAGLGKVGEAANLATKAAQAAKMGLPEAGELANAAQKASEGISFGAKIGSEAVKQAAEMAVMQGGDEASKAILNDPNQSAQSVIANIGLSTMLGGVTGGAVGTISPLWKATVGPKVEELLGTLKGKFNNETLLPKEGIDDAVRILGTDLTPTQRVLLSDKGIELGTLAERDNPKILNAIEDLKVKSSDSVAHSLGVNPEEIAEYDKADAGNAAKESFEKEFREKYGPIKAELDKHATEDALIHVADNDRLAQYDSIISKGLKQHSALSPYYKEYDYFAQRVLDAETIADVTKLQSEIGNRMRGMIGPGTDYNVKFALQDIKEMLHQYEDRVITRSITDIAQPIKSKSNKREMYNKLLQESGEAEYQKLGAAKINDKLEARRKYGEYAKMIDQAMDHFGMGHFSGTETLAHKLAGLSPEDAIRKFSFKNNSEAIPFLKQYFPKTFEKVRGNEVKEFLKPSMLKGAEKGHAIDIIKLNKDIAKLKAGQNTYLNSVLTPEAISKAEAAERLVKGLPDFRSSKTAKWTEKLFAHAGGSALAGVAAIAGHNPLGGLMVGEAMQRLQHEAPDAIKLAYLTWLASEQPVKAEGFKAMVDFLDSSLKGQNLITKATSAVFKSGAKILSEGKIPGDSDRRKLDKAVTNLQKTPDKYMEAAGNSDLGHYMPNHQTAITQASTQALQYLQSIKPIPHRFGPLDKSVPPQPTEIARYNRALDIAQQPAIVLQHIKNGTLMPSDIQDLHNMYPSLYQSMVQSLTNEIAGVKADKEIIPYKTRMSLSLFMGQPLDATMSPQAIMAAQPQPTPMPSNQGGAKGNTRKGTSTLGKSNSNNMTASQHAEADRSDRT